MSSQPQDIAARDDARLRSLGIKPELRRTLGFLSNFAIAFAFYGGAMIVNIALWADPGLFGDFGGDGRAFWNPFINSFLQWFGQPLKDLPSWPLYETIVITLLILGALYYVVSVRGRAADIEVDAATGESTIG